MTQDALRAMVKAEIRDSAAEAAVLAQLRLDEPDGDNFPGQFPQLVTRACLQQPDHPGKTDIQGC